MLVLAIIMLLMHPLLFCIKNIKNKKNRLSMRNTSLVRDPVISAPEYMVFQSLSFYARNNCYSTR